MSISTETTVKNPEIRVNDPSVFGSNCPKQLGFKLHEKDILMDRVFSEYTENQIREMYDMYSNDTIYDYSAKLTVGNKIKGTLAGQTTDSFLVDIGYKDYIRIDNRKEEITALSKIANEDGEIEIGTEVDLMISSITETPFLIKGSFSAVQKEILHDRILDNLESISFDAYIKSSVPAGYIVELMKDDFKMPSFMPNILAGINKVADPEALVGQTIKVMIESYSPDKGTYISSRKKYLKSLIPNVLENLVNIDSNNKPVPFVGKITGNTSFGIFVEFEECLTGMIHEANLSKEWVNRLKNGTINADETIEFFVKEIFYSKEKLMLVQEWRETMWDTIQEGQIYTAVVEDFKKFGVLARLDSETMGLIKTVDYEKSERTVEKGESIQVVVSSVQRGDRKIFFNFQ